VDPAQKGQGYELASTGNEDPIVLAEERRTENLHVSEAQQHCLPVVASTGNEDPIVLAEATRKDLFNVSEGGNVANSIENRNQRGSSNNATAVDSTKVHPESAEPGAQSRIKIKRHRDANPKLRESKRSRAPIQRFQAGHENGKGLEQSGGFNRESMYEDPSVQARHWWAHHLKLSGWWYKTLADFHYFPAHLKGFDYRLILEHGKPGTHYAVGHDTGDEKACTTWLLPMANSRPPLARKSLCWKTSILLSSRTSNRSYSTTTVTASPRPRTW